ncbi:MAG: DegT/DnrJ/EryC1/StrS family aminotransferase [Chlorobi bacterium]|nr:DegT/DnrJ/EryC1/StrS family aminotransferase [Chlorobiota bacterium]MCI0716080.1 DegT/DnrJ/EryC1/StrS family aminotransferase [Chlorobiota bacterium]
MNFSIGFDKRDLPRVHEAFDKIVASNKWTEGYYTELFENKWSELNKLPSVAFSSWAGAALAAMEFYKLKGKTVLCPSNTFMATPLVTLQAGAEVQFVDSNRFDLCMSFDDMKQKAEKFKPAAIWVVHIGGHIAFEIEKIAEYCKANNIILLEDCAHSHGASWNGKNPGEWGDAGFYSFYATKSITTGEGGMLVSNNNDLIEYAKKFRNYGKFDYKVRGLNYRITEFQAAVGAIQAERLKEIIDFKNDYAGKLDSQYPNRVKLPDGMISGYYKYIVFDPIEKSTGKVYDEQCHRILNHNDELPNSDWISKNHWCVPIYYNK